MALATALLAGCGAAEEREDASAVPTFVGRVDLEIGEVAGEDPYLFTYIGAVAADEGGRLLVADLQTDEVRVFDPEGVFLFGFGGAGEGPGELNGPCCLGLDPDGLLWVRESGRYSVFRLAEETGEFERTAPIHGFAFGMHAPLTFDGEGRLIDISPVRVPEGENTLARLHVDPSGRIDTVLMASPPNEELGVRQVEGTTRDGLPMIAYLYQPYGPAWLHTHGPNGWWAEAVSSRYEVLIHRPEGDTVRIERAEALGPEVSPAERERGLEAIEQDLDRVGLRSSPFEVPERKPPLADLCFDRSGRLWVELSGPDGSEEREAHVYDAEGRHVADYRWPRRVRQGASPWITEEHLYGVTTDSLGVQRAARVRFEPAGS